MSASLYWRPYQPEPEGEQFGYQLKWLLVERLGLEGDGSVNTDWVLAGESLVPWLEGIRDGGGAAADDANKLLTLIAKYGTVEVRVWNG